MIDRVVICGIRRGPERVKDADILQLAGRCGRSYNASDKGTVTLFAPPEDVKDAEACLLGAVPAIESHMSKLDKCAFHLLPRIVSGSVEDVEGVARWHSRSLAKFQGLELDYAAVVGHLFDHDMIFGTRMKFEPTLWGRISSIFYYMPARVAILKEKFMELYGTGKLLDDCAFAWMLGHKPFWRELEDESTNDFRSGVAGKGLRFHYGEFMDSYFYYTMLAGIRPQAFKFEVAERRNDVGRLFAALAYAAEHLRYDCSDELEIMKIRLMHGVNFDVARIMIEAGIKKATAVKLVEFGVKTRADLDKRIDIIRNYGDPAFHAEAAALIKKFE